MDPHWSNLDRIHIQSDWLKETGSLTRRIRLFCSDQFALHLIKQKWQILSQPESRILNLKPRQFALCRQTVLACHNQAWIFALTQIPYHAFNGQSRCLKRLGNKPLGQILFRHPSAKRQWIQIARLMSFHSLYQLASVHFELHNTELWARRSLLIYQQNPILIYEVFSPFLTNTK